MDEFGTDINVGSKNLIDRQKAIDKFEPWLKVEGYSEGERNMLKAVLYELTVMPSAQPEIITCKDCYWWTKQEYSLQGRCDRYGMYPTGYWYCAGARERRTDE